MGPDADRGDSIADVGKRVHHEEQGLVLPDQEHEPAIPWDGNPLGLVITEVRWRPFVPGDKVIEKQSC